MEKIAWDTFISKEVQNYLREFQEMEIVVSTEEGAVTRVRVHAPFMMETVNIIGNKEAFNKLYRRHRYRLKRVKKARESASESVKALLKRHFYEKDGLEAPVARGRAGLEAIKKLLQEAVSLRLVPTRRGRPYPNGKDLRQWLKKYGIGADCSAFVQHTLTQVVRACYATIENASVEGQNYRVRQMLSRGVYQDILGDLDSGDRFAPVLTPGAARPGDVLVRRGHIRIVASTKLLADGGIMLNLAECTASKGVPVGQPFLDTDIGPRCIQIQYPEPDRPIREQTPLRKRLWVRTFKADKDEKAYILGRFRALARFYEEHPAQKVEEVQPVQLTSADAY